MKPGALVSTLLATAAALAAPAADAASGLFKPSVAFATTSWPEAVAIGDLNGDGRNDVALVTSSYVSPGSDQTLFVWLQKPDGTLDSAVKYPLPGEARSVAIGDVNGDGRADVVAACGSTLAILRQNLAGTLDAAVPRPTPEALRVRIGDLNDDGRDDIVSLGWGTNAVAVFLQANDGSLNAGVSYPAPHSGYDDLEVGDVTGDGRTDVIVMSGQLFATPNVSVLPQQPDGTMGAPQSYFVTPSINTHGIGVGDVNGDGRNDVVASYGGNSPSSRIAVLAQNTLGTLDAPQSLVSYDIPEPVVVADVNADGLQDILVAHGGWQQLGTYLQSPTHSLVGELFDALPVASHYNPHGLAVGDISGDGGNDVVIADYNHGLVVLYNAGIPQATVSPATVAFGKRLVGVESAPISVTVHSTGALGLAIQGMTTSAPFSAASDCPDLLPPGASCTIDVRFTPVALGLRSGTLTVTTNEAAPHTVALTGTGARFELTPLALTFDPRSVGTTSAPQSVTVTNSTLGSLPLTPTVTGNFVMTNGCPASLDAGANCAVEVAFAPLAKGKRTGKLTVKTPSGSLFSSLTGTGVVITAVTVSPLSLNLGNQPIGASTQKAAIVTNKNLIPVQLSSIAITGPFVLWTNCPLAPASLAPSTSCQVAAAVDPAAVGPVTGSLLVTDTLGTKTISLKANAVPRVEASDPTIAEGDAGTQALTFTLTLAPAATKNVKVVYQTVDHSAHAGSDYVARSGSITFTPGQTQRTVDITINGDVTVETDETFSLSLVSGATSVCGDCEGIGTITNDDAAPAGTMISALSANPNPVVLVEPSTISFVLSDPLGEPLSWSASVSVPPEYSGGSAFPASGGPVASGSTVTTTYQTPGGLAVGTVTITAANSRNDHESLSIAIPTCQPSVSGSYPGSTISAGSSLTFDMDARDCVGVSVTLAASIANGGGGSLTIDPPNATIVSAGHIYVTFHSVNPTQATLTITATDSLGASNPVLSQNILVQ